MKIGVYATTYDKGYGRWGEDKVFEKLSELGFDAVDITMADTEKIPYNLPEQEMNAYLLRLKNLAEESKVEISQVHGPWRWPPRDKEDEDRAERMEKMKKSIYATSVLGCKNWVIHPIMPYGTQDILLGKEQETWEMNIEFMRELLVYAKKYDVTICLENMPMLNFSIAKPEKILEFVKTIDDEHFKICFDTGHVNVFDDLSVGDEVRRLGKEIRTFHIHDNSQNRDSHQCPYFGTTDWDDFAKALRDINFNGVFSLETRPSGKLPTPIFVEMSKSLVQVAKDIISKIPV